MHLKQLKLAGFKSFVDPTIIPFPSQLVAVVGPNGCGKSNVIDAVRWVMGESSAKNLRGESMADVIFNGSSNRKAIGQASVELVFDNSMGRLTGQYASYQEIAVKRLITRDGESSYFLNGTRCRRRDITDIFLGTGAGSRGYSIIGQGTISRLVEARPEELRTFLEEAAGISKYKERRRETLTRITHTRENLARVADIRDELDKQLHRLERQAKAAERYQLLREEEKRCKIDILALKWKKINHELTTLKKDLMDATLHYEEHQSLIANLYNQSTQLREQWEAENTDFQILQADFYKLTTEIAVLEENVQQQNREKQRLHAEQQQLQTEWQTLSSQIEQEKYSQQESEHSLVALQNSQQLLKAEAAEQHRLFQEVQSQQRAWQEEWELTQKALSLSVQQEKVEQLQLNHLIQQQQDILLRLEKIDNDILAVEEELMQYQPVELEQLLQNLHIQSQQNQLNYEVLQSAAAELRHQLRDVEADLQQEQECYHQLKTEIATLEALIHAALGASPRSNSGGQSFLDCPRLIESLSVEEEWQKACEIILGDNLQAYVVDEIKPFLPATDWEPTPLVLTTSKKKAVMATRYPRLSDKINSDKPAFLPDFDKIFTAPTLAEACEWLAFINEDESVITPQGYWLGKGWIRIKIDSQQTSGLLARQQQLKQLQQNLTDSQEKRSILKAHHEDLSAAINDKTHNLTLAQQTLADGREKIRSCEMEIKSQERLLEQISAKKLRLIDEKDDLTSQRESKVYLQTTLEISLLAAGDSRQQNEAKQSQLMEKKGDWESELRDSQEAWESIRTQLYQCDLQVEKQQLTLEQANKNIIRDNIRLQNLTERLESLVEQLLTFEMPDASLLNSLNDKLSSHRELEHSLKNKRECLNTINSTLENEETQWKSEEKLAKVNQEKIQQQQLQLQTLLVQANNLEELLTESHAQVELVLSMISPTATIQQCEQTLLELDEKIKRLGAINLAAIEEYSSEAQRKHYLDAQYDDLTEALNTLDAAIEKMDKETKQKLQLTFDEVNRAFQALFPRLFGGGRAMLELTCDNLLEAGVLVMAQPPGKRNSTIHLLSGGEKAMTAVALVFAIFQLNPSPFCMLDEVDAPLDDINVGRFCALVKEMSQFVQFLFITHNKVTMELAEHLIGVTMHEPGVSRVVSVDVEQALAMTEE